MAPRRLTERAEPRLAGSAVDYPALTLPSPSAAALFNCQLPRRIPMRKAKLVSLALGTTLLFTAAWASAQTPAPPPPYGMPINLEQAKKVMAGAEAEAKKNNWPVVIVIL